MIGRLKDLAFGRHGEQIVSFTTTTDFRQRFDDLKEHELDIEIKRHRNRRSLDANAYAWVLIDRIAEAMSITREEVYREAIRGIGGVSDIVCVQDAAVDNLRRGWEKHGTGWQTETMPSKIEGCTNVILYYGSSVYDTKQMSLLIDKLVQDAKALGIETVTPAELERLEGYQK